MRAREEKPSLTVTLTINIREEVEEGREGRKWGEKRKRGGKRARRQRREGGE